MKQLRRTLFALCLGLLITMILPNVRADEWDRMTTMTFSGPVELPGVVLPAGTYIFRLLDSSSNRNIVQVFSEDKKTHYATILASPNYRITPKSDTVVTFHERAAGAPQAIKAWFYPGINYGQEFVYPKVRATELAKVDQEPVPSMPETIAEPTPEPEQIKEAEVKVVEPSGQEVQLAEVEQAAMPQPVPTAPPSLPKAASPMPLFLLVGLIASGGAMALRLLSRRF